MQEVCTPSLEKLGNGKARAVGQQEEFPAVCLCLPNPGCQLSCHKCLPLSVDHGPSGLHKGGSPEMGWGSRGQMAQCLWSLDQVHDRD